jgi:RNA polymerase sigma-70 factor (ECF subfamily)
MSVDLEEALADLAPRVLRYVGARVGDASLAEEIAQECLAALVRHWRHAGPPESADAFVFSIARRRAGRAVLRRRLWLPLEHATEARSESPGPEARAVARAEQLRVRKSLGRLSRRDREAILMVAVGGLTMADAASALGIGVSAVKMRVSRARARLAQLLEDGHETRTVA